MTQSTDLRYPFISITAFTVCGLWIIGLGLYFMFLRPALLPEDYRYLATTPSDVQAILPGLERWMNRVFTVMGGFMTGAGLLILLATRNPATLRGRLRWFGLGLTGIFTVGVMSLTNFRLDSDFKWLLLMPPLLWLAGLFSLALQFKPTTVPQFSRHRESSGFIQAPPEKVFALIDDPLHLASHMSQSSWMMGGGKMTLELDHDHGQKIGSRITMSGKAFGIPLSLEEAVIERDPPRWKVWETTSPPKLLVISHYRMGFQITPQGNGVLLRVFIDYSLPDTWLGSLFGDMYARWCTKRIVTDAARLISHPI